MVAFGVLARIVRTLQAPWVEYVVGAFFLLTGFTFAVLSSNPGWLNRFGALLVVYALVMASTTFRFQLEYETFREHLRHYQIRIHALDTEDFTETDNGKSYYRLEFPEIALFSFVRENELKMKHNISDLRITIKQKEDLIIFYILQQEFETFHKTTLNTIKRQLNSGFRMQFRYAVIGTLVWAFGDLFIFWL